MNELEGWLVLNIGMQVENPWAFVDTDCITREKPTFIIFPGQEVIDPSEELHRRVGIVQEAIDPSGASPTSSLRGSPAQLLILWEDGELELRDNYSVVQEHLNNGLIDLRDGDRLTIFERGMTRNVLFQGVVDLELITDDAQKEESQWYEWFLGAHPARLKRERGFTHRFRQEAIKERRRRGA